MKTVSSDQTYIDYTKGNFGIRVWENRCQAIARTDESCQWEFRETAKPLPVDDRFRNLPLGGAALQPVPAIAFEIGRIGSDELRQLVSGEMAFKDAVSPL